MNKFRSKSGFTLVELVVTIGVLSIVAGLGVGMVAQAIKNYSTAQTTSTEQDNALEIEDFLLSASKVGASVSLVNSSSVPLNDVSAYYIYFDNDGTLKTVRSEVTAIGQPPVVTTISYHKAKSVQVQVKKHKPQKDDSLSEKCFMYVDYVIEMNEGYKLDGTIVMNNADSDTPMTQINTSFDDVGDVCKIENDSTTKAIAFVQ